MLALLFQGTHDLLNPEFTPGRHWISSVNSKALALGLALAETQRPWGPVADVKDWAVSSHPLVVLSTVPLFSLSLKSPLQSLGLESTGNGFLEVVAFRALPLFLFSMLLCLSGILSIFCLVIAIA